MSDLTIRIARPDDAARLLEIYAPYVEETAISFEYEVPTIREFRARIEATLKKYPYIVALKDGVIVGYAYAGAFKERAAYDWSVETSIYVDRGAHGCGTGRKLYEALEQYLQRMHILNVNACIAVPRGTDDPHLTDQSVRFHRHLGYQMVGTFHDSGYKFDRWYDMAWMEKMIGDHTGTPEAVKTFPDIL